VSAVQNRAAAPRRASALDVAKAVLWSFLGVRKRKDYDRDSVSISPLQIVIAGIVGGVLFVLGLVMLVRLVVAG
jgi:hypothetical protein